MTAWSAPRDAVDSSPPLLAAGRRQAAVAPLTADRPTVVAFGPNAWSERNWQTRQQLLSRLAARGWPVVYSQGALSVWERRGETWRGAGRRSRVRESFGVHVLEAGRVSSRWPRFATWDGLAVRRHATKLHGLAGRIGDTPGILHLFGPQFAPYARFFPGWRLVYHVEDAFDLMPNWSPEQEAMQADLVARADLVVACAESMARRLPAGRAEVHLLPNGVDVPAYVAGGRAPCPDDLAAVPGPRIGYIGSLNRKVDYGLISRIARRRPDWQWVLIGATVLPPAESGLPEVAAYDACRSLPNVHLLGAKDFRALPAYAAHLDVNTICYRSDGDGWWHACDPLKSAEYLAAGRPVVSADLENVRPHADLIALARSDDEWIEALDRALAGQGPGTPAQRQAAAQARDWEHLADRLDAWLCATVAIS